MKDVYQTVKRNPVLQVSLAAVVAIVILGTASAVYVSEASPKSNTMTTDTEYTSVGSTIRSTITFSTGTGPASTKTITQFFGFYSTIYDTTTVIKATNSRTISVTQTVSTTVTTTSVGRSPSTVTTTARTTVTSVYTTTAGGSTATVTVTTTTTCPLFGC